MAAVSAWAKPGAWALDAEQHEAADHAAVDPPPPSAQPSADFPSLAAAAATKTKKKKAQTLSLAEFNTGRPTATPASRPYSVKALTTVQPLELPTGPRERSAEELERGGRGFSSYGGGRGRAGEDASDPPRRGGAGGGFDSGPSRADEVDDWGATKRAMAPPERRERGAGFFGDSQSRADDSDSWISRKPAALPSDGPRERRGGFETFNRESGGLDSGTWGRKREEEPSSGGGRPRLALQPRTQPLANDNNNKPGEQPDSAVRSKGLNPFGGARPREEVLKEKGQDWKTIDAKLESVKIQPEGQQLERKGFRTPSEMGRAPENRTERAWRKPDTVEVSREEKLDERPSN